MDFADTEENLSQRKNYVKDTIYLQNFLILIKIISNDENLSL